MSAYKPKIYRSQEGCCICKAKSSSSRFTDSGKYEDDCTDCFKLAENRRGEICNACVLIVKRWKKLPRNTGKNWAHVVDARTGPGTKNIFKQKKKDSPVPPFEKPYKYKHVYKRKPMKTKKREEEEEQQVNMLSTRAGPWSSTYSSTPEFLDNSYWRRQTVCCGVVYLGRLGEAMMDQRLYQPCMTNGKHDLTLTSLGEDSLQPSPSSSLGEPSPSASVQPPASPSSSAFSSSLTPSSIESLVEAELQAFQSMETMEEEEEFYMDASKVLKKRELSELSSEIQPIDDGDGDEGFCDRLDQKSEQFRSSLSLIAIH